MVLFDSHWNEDNIIFQENDLCARMPIFEDNWEDNWREISDQIHHYFENLIVLVFSILLPDISIF